MVTEGGSVELPGIWLRQQREAAGMTQEELAERSGVSARTISDLERGRVRRPYPRSVRLLTGALALPETAGDELVSRYRSARDDGTAAARRVPGGLTAAASLLPPSGGVSPAVVPRELPAAVAHFAGRADELKALDGLAELSARTSARAVTISAIGGTAGVGKTALAVHWAHQVADEFPDGQLYANLRGYDPGQPVRPADALAGFLRALGVPGRDIPAEADERAARYRSLLAGRRVLVVLDNAGSAEQVRPLLPGAPACLAVVTSRDSLAGLVARDGARRLDLDLLPLADAVGLLRALIGNRVDADPDAAAALAGQCARLPLALRVAAEFAAARPGASLAGLVGELADQQRRLDLLDAGRDTRTAVRAVFSWSCQHLDADAARAFRLLGLAPGPDLDRYAAAALTDTTVERAGAVLDLLARAHLIQASRPGRYGLHDLLRAYARERAAADDGEGEMRAALTRLFDYYLQAAATAMDALFPAERHARPSVRGQNIPAPPVASPALARTWLDAERAGLVDVAAHTARNGWLGHATGLAATLFRYLDSGGHFPDALAVHGHARYAARLAGDRTAEATALISLGLVRYWQGSGQQAADFYQQALALFCEAGDQPGQARAMNSLGLVDLQHGPYQRARGHFQAALALHRAAGDRLGEARALDNLGFAESQQGQYQEASDLLQQAVALYREVGHQMGEARALGNLGLVDLHQGHYQQARARMERTLALCHEAGDRIGEARALSGLGEVDRRQGRHQQAVGRHRQSLALCREIGDRPGEALALNGLGEAFIAAGKLGHARAEHAAALGLAAQIGYKYEEARAHNGLARAYHATGRTGQARRHWQESLAIYTGLGAAEADQVRDQLASADSQAHHAP
jgi:tetratricopeptide (TPR) repeat protein/transcriptional regulator with XRE-family HTH domain